MTLKDDVSKYSSALLFIKKTELSKIRANSTPIQDSSVTELNLDPYFQIVLMHDLCNALLRLLENSTVQYAFANDDSLSQLKIENATSLQSIISKIINQDKNNYKLMKFSIQGGFYLAAVVYAAIAPYALLHLVAAVFAAQFTMYLLLHGLLQAAVVIFATLASWSNLNKTIEVKNDFNLLESVLQENEPKSTFSAEFTYLDMRKIPCTRSAYQLAQSFFSVEQSTRNVAEETFEAYNSAPRSR